MQQIENELPKEGVVEVTLKGEQLFKNLQAAQMFCLSFNITNYNLRTLEDNTVLIQYQKENV